MFELIKTPSIDWIGLKKPFIFISTALLVLGGISALTRGLNLGIDFAGGTLVTIKFEGTPPPENQIRDALGKQGIDTGKVILQPINDPLGGSTNQLLIRLPQREAGQAGPQVATPPGEAGAASPSGDASELDVEKRAIQAALAGFTTKSEMISAELVGPQIGEELRQRAIYVTLASLVGMLIYIAFRFEWVYGVAAVVAVFHDVLVTLGIFSLLQKEISLNVVAALLTLIGYSVNDTIVIFDRIRENLKLRRRDDLRTITNDSINQTLSRSILTSGLTFLAVAALYLFGGEVLSGFSLALVIGIIVGSYSTIAIASPIMLWWQQWQTQRQLARKAASRASLVESKSAAVKKEKNRKVSASR